MSKLFGTIALALGIFLTCAAPSCSGSVPITEFTSPPEAVCHLDELGRVDSRCTPGMAAQTPEVLADAPAYRNTLCAPSDGNPATKTWVQARRPPTSYTDRVKAEQMWQYGMLTPEGALLPLRSVQEDHIIPLSLDGAPRDPRNLAPHPWEGPYGVKAKDADARRLWRAVCSGTLTLDQAQAAITEEWVR